MKRFTLGVAAGVLLLLGVAAVAGVGTARAAATPKTYCLDNQTFTTADDFEIFVLDRMIDSFGGTATSAEIVQEGPDPDAAEEVALWTCHALIRCAASMPRGGQSSEPARGRSSWRRGSPTRFNSPSVSSTSTSIATPTGGKGSRSKRGEDVSKSRWVLPAPAGPWKPWIWS